MDLRADFGCTTFLLEDALLPLVANDGEDLLLNAFVSLFSLPDKTGLDGLLTPL